MEGADALAVESLRWAGWSVDGARRVVHAGVRVELARAAIRLARSRYPLEGGAAERYALYLLAV